MKALPKAERDLRKKIRKHERLRAEAKRKYAEADLILDNLLSELQVGREVRLTREGTLAKIKDNYLGTNKVFRAHGINRYELEITP